MAVHLGRSSPSNAGEPQNPLIPTNTNENNGGRIVDRLFAGLMSYDARGNPTPRWPSPSTPPTTSTTASRSNPDGTFTDGSPVTAKSFVDAWNYGALSTNAQLQQSFFSARSPAMTRWPPRTRPRRRCPGLQIVDDTEFTVRLKAPTIDFKHAAGVHAVLPAAGRRRSRTWPRSAATRSATVRTSSPTGDAWQHNVHIDLVPNPGYHGNRTAEEQGSAARVLRQPRHRLRRPAGRQSRCAGHHSAQCAAHLPQRPR